MKKTKKKKGFKGGPISTEVKSIPLDEE